MLQIIATSIGTLGFGSSIVLWFLGRNRKGLGYEVLSIDPLIEKKSESADRLEIRFNDRVVEQPHVVRVRVCNAERQVIRREDFRRPITISFRKADAFPFTAPRCHPESLVVEPPNWEMPQEVSIQALDINPGAEIEITALVARRLEPDDVECHT